MPGRGGPYRINELGNFGRLQQITARARSHRVENVLSLAASRQHQDPDASKFGEEPPGYLGARHVWQVEVEQYHIRSGRDRYPDRLRSVACSAHDLVPGLVEASRGGVAPDWMIVNHQDPHWRRRCAFVIRPRGHAVPPLFPGLEST